MKFQGTSCKLTQVRRDRPYRVTSTVSLAPRHTAQGMCHLCLGKEGTFRQMRWVGCFSSPKSSCVTYLFSFICKAETQTWKIFHLLVYSSNASKSSSLKLNVGLPHRKREPGNGNLTTKFITCYHPGSAASTLIHHFFLSDGVLCDWRSLSPLQWTATPFLTVLPLLTLTSC